MNVIYDPDLVLYLPLYEMNGDNFISKDSRGHTCIVNRPARKPCGWYFDGVDDIMVTGRPVLPDNWYCVGGLYNGKMTKAWLDGIEGVNTNEWYGAIDNNNVNLTIGTRRSGGWQFAGEIGEVLVYNRALAAPEILNYYLVTR